MTRLEAWRAIEVLHVDGDKHPGNRVVYRHPDPGKLHVQPSDSTTQSFVMASSDDWRCAPTPVVGRGFLRAIR